MERSAGGNFRNSKEPGQIAKTGDQTGGNGPAVVPPGALFFIPGPPFFIY